MGDEKRTDASNSYVAIDLETTGLDPKRERIIEIGAVRVEDGEVTGQFSSFVNPRMELAPRIVELTGIEDSMLSGAPEIGEIIGEVLAFCGGLPLLGHHVIFDYSFLKRGAVNAGLSFERLGFDTLKLSRRFMPEEEKKNLASACAYFGVEQEPAHRALGDAVSAHRLYQTIRSRYFQETPEAFSGSPLIYKIKKEQPASKLQKEVLRELVKYHRINLSVQIDSLSRNEVSRITDRIISQYGRMTKR